MLNVEDLPIDPDQIALDVDTALFEETLNICNIGVILGQLDPTELGTDGQPRWDEDQRSIIIKMNDALKEWRDE